MRNQDLKKTAKVMIIVGVLASLYKIGFILLSISAFIFSSRIRLSNRCLAIALINLIMTVWVCVKGLELDLGAQSILIQIYQPVTLLIFSIFVPQKGLIKIYFYVVCGLCVADLICNVSQHATGADFLGNTLSYRVDGNRAGGIMGHAFYSIAISVSTLLLMYYFRTNKYIIVLPLLNLVSVGSFRAYIYIFCTAIYLKWLKRVSVPIQLGIGVFVVGIFVGLTFIDVELINNDQHTGNLGRTIAWTATVERLKTDWLFGVNYVFDDPFYGNDYGSSVEWIEKSGTTESNLLRDWQSYGALYITLALSSIVLYSKSFSPNNLKYCIGNEGVIAILWIVDYMLMSLFGHHLVALTSAIIFSSVNYLPNGNDD